jgi:putative transposase
MGSKKMRKRHSAEFKAQVALAAIQNTKTLNELAGHFEVHPNLIREWKKQALAAVPDAFSGRRAKDATSNEALLTSLYEQIGRMKVELEWLKKKLGPWT